MRFLLHRKSWQARAITAAVLLPILFCTRTTGAGAAPPSADEYAVKAAFLYNLAKFVDWPPRKFRSENSPLVIGVLGDESFERISGVIRNKTIEKRKVLVRRLADGEAINNFHILFVSRYQNQQTPFLMDGAKKAAVLMVGETEAFLESGGMIRFYLDADNLRLEIDAQSVHEASLNIKANALSTLINKGIAKFRKP